MKLFIIIAECSTIAQYRDSRPMTVNLGRDNAWARHGVGQIRLTFDRKRSELYTAYLQEFHVWAYLQFWQVTRQRTCIKFLRCFIFSSAMFFFSSSIMYYALCEMQAMINVSTFSWASSKARNGVLQAIDTSQARLGRVTVSCLDCILNTLFMNTVFMILAWGGVSIIGTKI